MENLTIIQRSGKVTLTGQVVDHKTKKLGRFQVFSRRRRESSTYFSLEEAERVYRAEVSFEEGAKSISAPPKKNKKIMHVKKSAPVLI